MQKNNPMTFTLSIVAIIVGLSLWRSVDFSPFTVQKPALSAIYLITFVVAVYILIKNSRRR